MICPARIIGLGRTSSHKENQRTGATIIFCSPVLLFWRRLDAAMIRSTASRVRARPDKRNKNKRTSPVLWFSCFDVFPSQR
jgi:hypothetical protein